MNIKIKRFDIEKESNTIINNFNIQNKNLLQAFNEIKSKQDSTLTYRCGCKSGVCGSCVVRVNGIEKLACKTLIKEK
mgnify:CR=1 FL=1